jgi:hypothetical protein
MTIRVKLAALKEGHWYEYLVRFILGGFATVAAGLVADIWGPRRRRAVFSFSRDLLRKRYAY